jgi:hypothetical protein
MLLLDECRIALGSMADHKSDDEIARMREQAAAIARIVIRTYFGATSEPSSYRDAAGPPGGAPDSLVEQNGGNELSRHKRRRHRRRVRRRPAGQAANSDRERRLRGESTMQT